MNNSTPFFSVVIPLYNKEHFIEACLQSVFNQHFKNYEIIIVDDGSTDASLAKLKNVNHENLVIVKQVNKGAAAARNKGVQLAKAKWIAFLDADDLWKENHLSEFYKAIEQFPDEAVFTSRMSIIEPNNSIRLAEYNFRLSKDLQALSYFKNSEKNDLLNTSGVLIKKTFFLQLNGFNEQIYSGQDTDLFIRIGLQKKVVFNPISTFLHYKTSENNISKTPRFSERLQLLANYQSEAENNPYLLKYLDLNRFSIYLRSKMHGDETWKRAKKQIDQSNLNAKQVFLMQLPSWLLKTMKIIQFQLLRLGINKSAF